MWRRVLHAEWPPWEEFLVTCARFEICLRVRRDTTIRAENIEMGEATDLEQAPDPWVIDGRHRVRTRKVKPKPRYRHEVPMLIEKLKGFVRKVIRPRPPADRLVIQICSVSKSIKISRKYVLFDD
jgi:hypothetical protein